MIKTVFSVPFDKVQINDAVKDIKLKYYMLVMRIFPSKRNTERASKELMASIDREILDVKNNDC